MSTLNFIITDAGFQAAINANATGLKLTLTEVAYGSGIWSPDITATALQNEIKKLPAGGGDNPAPNYVHITASDQSSDSYQATEIGIYAGNILFAIWSKGLQPESGGLSKISTQYSAFAFDLMLSNIPADSVTVNDVGFSVPIATESTYGVARIATLDEVVAGVNEPLIITPYVLEQWRKKTTFKGYAGQLFEFTTPDIPHGFPAFICNGSRVPNGRIDFNELATSGSAWITVDGDDLIIHDSPDYTRGKGSSARSIGEFETDAIRNIAGEFSTYGNSGSAQSGFLRSPYSVSGAFKAGTAQSKVVSVDSGFSYGVMFDASLTVPTANENRGKSKTVLRAIYHGES